VRVGVPNLRDEWKQHAEHDDGDVRLGEVRLVAQRCVDVAVDDGLFMHRGGLGHGMHSDIAVEDSVSTCG
jgi:hypothetical protein